MTHKGNKQKQEPNDGNNLMWQQHHPDSSPTARFGVVCMRNVHLGRGELIYRAREQHRTALMIAKPPKSAPITIKLRSSHKAGTAAKAGINLKPKLKNDLSLSLRVSPTGNVWTAKCPDVNKTPCSCGAASNRNHWVLFCFLSQFLCLTFHSQLLTHVGNPMYTLRSAIAQVGPELLTIQI